MQFNLINERWIPVLRKDGTKTMIAPWEITDQFTENPVVSLDAPRPDFNGALIQFLIGLVQTVAAPQGAAEWRRMLNTPPSTEELKAKFLTVRHAFELCGDGPRFMQDLEVFPASDGTIDGLLIGMPSQNALKNNTDHFIKRNTVEGMCPSCCATALFAFQTNSPSGGQGYMVSLRGGGPLTTLVIGDNIHNTLWQTVCLNVLEHEKFESICGQPSLTEGRHIFPWLGQTKPGKRKKGTAFYGEDTVPELANPATMFWAMPRRIRVGFSDLKAGACDVCGATTEKLISFYREVPGGGGYKKWLHPLSPYYEHTAKGQTDILPVHAQPGGLTYRHWLGLVIQDSDTKKMPARVVHEFIGKSKTNWQFRLWAFGYDMSNDKVRCWYDSKMPILAVEKSILPEFEDAVAGIVNSASEIVKNTRSAIKNAWFRRPEDKKGDTSFIDNSFWQLTEADFYLTLGKLETALKKDGNIQPITEKWLDNLCKQSLQLFDNYAWEGPIEEGDPKRIVVARKDLNSFNRGKKIKKLLGICCQTPHPKKQDQQSLNF